LNDKGSMSQTVEIDAQLQQLAQVLSEARAPLIYGLTQLTIEAQELAVELAMCLRGAIDVPRGSRIPPRGTSLQLHGEARTTLGELRQYANLLLFVDCKSSPDLEVLFVPEGMASIPAKQQWSLRFSGDDKNVFETRVLELRCRSMDEVRSLRKKLKVKQPCDFAQEQLLAAWQNAKYPILIYKPELLHKLYGKSHAAYVIELLEGAALTRAKDGRAAAWPLESTERELTNAAGAEYVLTARTGYPAAVCLFSACAEYLPEVTNAEALLANGVVDAALFLGEGPQASWSELALQHLKITPTFLLASEDEFKNWGLQHQFLKSNDLKDENGTIVLEDGIPIPISFGVSPHPSMESVLRQLLALVREQTIPVTGAAR
jgi:formylmethanofuran dehydrogenase subunit B